MQTTQEEYDELQVKVAKITRQQECVLSGLGFVLHPLLRQSLEQFRSRTGSEGKVAIVTNSIVLSTRPDEETLSSQWAGLPPQEEMRVDSTLNITWEDIPTRKILSSTGLEPRLVEHFDVVAVNIIHYMIENDAWETALQNITNLVRPGGWIQWVDWDPITARLAGCRPGTPDASHFRDLLRTYTDVVQARKVGSSYRISNSLKKQSLVECDSDMYPVAPDAGLTCLVAEYALEYLEKTGHYSAEEINAILAKIEAEFEASEPLVWYDLWCHVARKPLKS